MAELEKQALTKQIEALKTAEIELKVTAEKAAELEKQLAIAKRPWWRNSWAIHKIPDSRLSSKVEFYLVSSKKRKPLKPALK